MGEQSRHVVWRVLRGPRILKRDMLLVRALEGASRSIVTRQESAHVMKSDYAIARKMLTGSRIHRADTTLIERRLRVPRVLIIRDDIITKCLLTYISISIIFWASCHIEIFSLFCGDFFIQ